MKLKDVLWRSAASLTSSQTVRRVELYAEIGRRQAYPMTNEVAQEIAALQAEADDCGQALRRFGTYRPDKEATCPYCWIVTSERSELSSTSQPDLHTCTACGAKYSTAPLPTILPQ